MEKIHSVEAGWLWRTDNGMQLTSTLYYRYLTNQITEVSRYIENGVLLTTKENLNTSQNAGLELIWSVPVARWLSLNWNVNGYHSQIDASRLGFGKNHNTFSWSTLLNANFSPTRHFMIQLNARPDGSSRNSFPSGHTATAFVGAELLRREYWEVSPWIGVAGYAVAAGTGFFRMYNNRHWLTDVLSGAGIGILSVEAAYWLYPTISKTFFRKRYLKNLRLSPYASPQEKGLACSIVF